jgi:hypothetical protein
VFTRILFRTFRIFQFVALHEAYDLLVDPEAMLPDMYTVLK